MAGHRRGMKAFISACVLILLAAACGGDDDDDAVDEGATTTAAGEVAGEPGGSLVVAGEQVPTSVNFLNSEHNAFWTSLWMQLVWPSVTIFQPDGTFVFNDDLVTSVELTSEDPQIVEYEINPDATWSDGTPITAADFLFTWEAMRGDLGEELDPTTGEPLPIYNAAGTTGYEDMTCEADGDKKVICEFTEIYADWYVLFSTVVPEHAFVAEGAGDKVAGFNTGFIFPDVNLDNVPSGAWFSIGEIDGESSLTLLRNEEYWGEPALLDEITIRWVTDPTQQPAALENGEADVAFPQAQIDLVQQTQGIPDVTSVVDFGTFFEHIDFNFSNVHLAKLEVRQAIGLALDRQDIVTRLPGQLSDEAQVMNNHFFYPGSASYEPIGEEQYGAQDIEGARALLEEAGYTEGADGVFEHPTDGRLSVRFSWRDPNPRRQQTAELAQASLAEAGIEIQFAPQPDFTFLDSGDFDVALFGWTSILTPSGHNAAFATGGGNNNGNYSNPEVDALFEQADQELDQDARLAIYNEIDAILWDDLPTIPLFQVPEFLAFRDTYRNIEHNGYNGFMYNANVWALAQ